MPQTLPQNNHFLTKDEREKRGVVRWRDFRGQKLRRVGIPSSGYLTRLQQKKDPLFSRIQNRISSPQKHIVVAPARKMKYCCFPHEMNSHLLSARIWPASPVKKSNLRGEQLHLAPIPFPLKPGGFVLPATGRAAVRPARAERGWGISPAQRSAWQTGQTQMLYFMQLLCFGARWDRLVLLAGCKERLHRQRTVGAEPETSLQA